MITGTVSGKGWVVIPQELRDRYRLKKGDKVHFIDYGEIVKLCLSPAIRSKNPLACSKAVVLWSSLF